jgi:hypothetical protein
VIIHTVTRPAPNRRRSNSPPEVVGYRQSCYGSHTVAQEEIVKATRRKKTYNLDAQLIERARRIFDVKTDTEAIQRALEKTIEDREIERALDRLLTEGRFRTVYR